MIKTALVGLGKMGISHLAILRAHPAVDLVAACDGLRYLTGNLEKLTGLRCYNDLDEMLANEDLDAIVIASPTKTHAMMVDKAIARGIHVFCEKPFVLDVDVGNALALRAQEAGLVTQVGYHYRFVATFREAARIVSSGLIGSVHHVRAEAYGPVVVRPKGSTWRSVKSEGGGAVYDYACHAIDLVNFVAGNVAGHVDGVSGVHRSPVFSKETDDQVYCTLHLAGGSSGQLCVNWSDASVRKMETKISVWGSKGRLKADRQECSIHLSEVSDIDPTLDKGWTVKNTTELTEPVWFYLRGEEYSAQIDYFVGRVKAGATAGHNTFESALQTDRVVAAIQAGNEQRAANGAPRPGIVRRLAASLRGEQ